MTLGRCEMLKNIGEKTGFAFGQHLNIQIAEMRAIKYIHMRRLHIGMGYIMNDL